MAQCSNCAYGIVPLAQHPRECRHGPPVFNFANDPYRMTTARWVASWPVVADTDWCGSYADPAEIAVNRQPVPPK